MSVPSLSGLTIAGKYAIKRLLGTGGMGAVYEGEHLEIGKRVAIKVIDASHAPSGELAERFRREARAASVVESDHIVQVFDVGRDDACGLYMVMELLSGEDVAERLKREGRLDPRLAITIALQSARALAKAHAAGVIHRDLKPANLFLTTREDGSPHVKILDFGISKIMREEREVRASTPPPNDKPLTRSGAVIGTPQYMSPEQAQGFAVDPRTDVWSLGAVLYEMLAGVGPYEDLPTYEQTIIQIVTKPPRPLREVAPWVTDDLAALVHAALAQDRETRLPDCASFARRLAGLPLDASAASVPHERAPGAEAARARDAIAQAPTMSSGVAIEDEARGAPRSGTKGIAIGLVAALVVAGFVVVRAVGSSNVPRDLGAHDAPSAPSSSPATVGLALVPREVASVASPSPSGSAIESAAIAASPAPSASAKLPPKKAPPSARPAVVPADARPSPKETPSPTQFGAAGVSTAY